MPAIRKPWIDDENACPDCDGTGMAEPECETCDGAGWVEDEEDGGTMSCPDCGGDECETCDGQGSVD